MAVPRPEESLTSFAVVHISAYQALPGDGKLLW
jgi:hypothetical protein